MTIQNRLFKTFTLTGATLVLCFTLAHNASASGGVMEIPPAPTPAPADAPVNTVTITAEPAQPDDSDPIAEAALSLVEIVLSLL
jgi:hypothetical protein